MIIKIDDYEFDREKIVCIVHAGAVEGVNSMGQATMVYMEGGHIVGLDPEAGALLVKEWRKAKGGVLDVRHLEAHRQRKEGPPDSGMDFKPAEY